jgi:hypothetical protein
MEKQMLEFLTQSSSSEYLTWGSQMNTWKVDGENCALKKLLIDPNSIMTGFGKIEKGVAPDWVWASEPGTTIPQPTPEHKPAFSVSCYISQQQGANADGLRDWQSNSRAAREAIKAVWENIDKGAKDNAGKWAVVSCEGSTSMQVGPATINVPNLTLQGWAALPALQQPETTPQQDEVAAAVADVF